MTELTLHLNLTVGLRRSAEHFVLQSAALSMHVLRNAFSVHLQLYLHFLVFSWGDGRNVGAAGAGERNVTPSDLVAALTARGYPSRVVRVDSGLESTERESEDDR